VSQPPACIVYQNIDVAGLCHDFLNRSIDGLLQVADYQMCAGFHRNTGSQAARGGTQHDNCICICSFKAVSTGL
jgi:hypothetical protein